MPFLKNWLKLSILLAGLMSAPVTGALADELGDLFDRGLRLYHEQRYAEAVPFFERAVALSEARYSDDDPAVALDLHNLAEVYRLTDRYEEAEALYLRAIALDQAGDPPDPVSLATSYNNLALVYRAQNRLSEAEQLYERALAILEDELGANHPNVARNLNNLAMVYAAQGHKDRATTLLDRAVRVSSDVLGPTHPTTVAVIANRDAMSGDQAVVVPPPEARPRTSVDNAITQENPGHLPLPERRPVQRAQSTLQSSDVRIHLASVRSPEAADVEWRRLASLYHLPGPIRQTAAEQIDVRGQGTFYRVTGGGFANLDEARAICWTIRERGDFCQVIIAN